MTHETRRFSELRADDVESNLFQYHLKHLINKKLVEKIDDGYQLAPQGLYYADRFSPVYKGERPQPKIITIVALKDSKGRVLLQRKPRQPWLGDYLMPAGKIHTGETTQDAAKRELEEKTGIHLDTLEFRSQAHVQIFKGDEVVSDYFGFIFAGAYDGTIEDGCWYSPDDEAGDRVLAPGVHELLAIERSGDKDFHQFVIKL